MTGLLVGLILIGLATLLGFVAAVMIFFNPWKSRRVTWGYAAMLAALLVALVGFLVAVLV